MKHHTHNGNRILVVSILVLLFILPECKKTENPIRFPKGTFPDTIINMSTINSQYDDYNIALYELNGNAPILFSSNRKSMGGQFDLEQATISFTFDQTNGNFEFSNSITNSQFFTNLINKAETNGNDFGPYRIFSSLDGFEYLILSSENDAGNMDFFYLKNRPEYNLIPPAIEGPYPVDLFNSNADDVYLCFDQNLDSAYFASDLDGTFDIYLHQRPVDQEISNWFDQGYSVSIKVDSLNSSGDDKCPLIYKNVMFFASDREGGLGGFDLYYSIYKDGSWGTPVNMGPSINTSSNEYRPVIGYHPEFTNLFMMFSSDRPGGKGGFDLYFTGMNLPK